MIYESKRMFYQKRHLQLTFGRFNIMASSSLEVIRFLESDKNSLWFLHVVKHIGLQSEDLPTDDRIWQVQCHKEWLENCQLSKTRTIPVIQSTLINPDSSNLHTLINPHS